MSEPQEITGPGEEMLALARDRRMDEVEAIWMRCIESPSMDLPELYRVADYLVRRKFDELANLLMWSLITTIKERQGAGQALPVAERCVEIAPESASLREELATLYRTIHKDIQEIEPILKASGLLEGAAPDKAMDRIRKCLRLRAGTFVIHLRSRRVGRVVQFSDGAFEIESEGMTQRMQPDDVLNVWEPLPEDDFRARIAFNPAKLRDMAAEDPIGLITSVLACQGGSAEFRQLKAMLIPAVIPVAGWSAWWNGVKVPLKRSPMHEIAEGTQPRITLRKQELKFSDELLASFALKADAYEKAKVVLDYLAEVDKGHEVDEALAVELGSRCLALGKEAADTSIALSLLSCAVEVRKRVPASPDPMPECAARLAQVIDIVDTIEAIPNDDLARAVLSMTADMEGEDYAGTISAAFPAGSLRLCEWIARELDRLGRPDLLKKAMTDIATTPEGHFEAMGWVWRRVMSGEGDADMLDPVRMTVLVLDVMRRLSRAPKHDTERRAEAKKALSKLRGLISANDMKLLGGLIEKSDTEIAHRLHEAIKNNEGLTNEMVHDLLGLLRERHPEEFIERKNLWEDEHIYTTAEGLAKRTAELSKLMNEDIPRNAIAIGKAASLGDLRENWEYKSALEERDRLVERTTRAKHDVDHARVLEPSAVTGEIVNVGTAIGIRHVASGKEKKLTFLGPWDSDISRGVYSYLAPLSQSFMGKKVGDRAEATFDDAAGTFEIVRIEKVI